MYDLLDWTTVNQLEFYQSVLMVYKIIKFGEPEQLATKLTRFNIRGNTIIDNSNPTLYRKSYSICAAEDYNSLQKEVKIGATIDCFKRNARCWIVKMCLVLRTNEEVSNDATEPGYGLNVPMI